MRKEIEGELGPENNPLFSLHGHEAVLVDLTNGVALSEAAHMVETFTRVDYDQLNYTVVIEDPSVLTKPWTVRRTFMLRDGQRIREDICPENNMDPARFDEFRKKPELYLRSPDARQPR